MSTEIEAGRTESDPALMESWKSPPGFGGWFRVVNHQSIGLRYIVTAFIFLLAGGIEALLMRIQLMRPENHFMDAGLYNQIFTMHGTTMMFLFAVPVMEGMGVYLVPLMVGTRNVAFPRLNAFGYYIYLIGGIFLYTGFFLSIRPDAGWFSYTPLSGPDFSPGKGVDFWAQMITFTELSALVVAVELIVTIFKQRAPGMSLNRMPMFVWSMLVQSFMVVFAMPAIMAASSFLLMDRTVGTHFLNPAEGGNPLLWQHLFWFFGHPEVYIIFIPALGMVSSIVSTFANRKLFGYTALVLSLVTTGFLGFGLWVHHMFATGLPQLGESFFTAASMTIAIPSGVQIFCWLATLWGGKVKFEVPLLFVIGFIVIFVLGGLTGVMIASVPFDLQVHDTFFIVAHFHYVLIGGALFPLFGGFYFWFPKFTGRLMSRRLGILNFWLLFIGFNLTFFPMHQLGFKGMPRRVYTYPLEMGWGNMNLIATMGAILIAVGGAVFIANVVWSRRRGIVAGRNPWSASSLEWATQSPPRNYNFIHLPVIDSAYPLWPGEDSGRIVSGLRTDRREVLVTTILDAAPHHRYVLPGPTLWPLLASLAVTLGFVGSVFNPWWVVPGLILTGIALAGWFWPHSDPRELHLGDRNEA